MNDSFADALTPVASRQHRVVRTHEVLRVAGLLPAVNALDACTKAREEALKWATRQSGTTLPKEAWAGESFDLSLPGRDPSAIRILTEAADLWAFRLHRPDRDVPGRAWTTEVVIGYIPNEPARFSARLLVATDELDCKFVPAVPGFVRQVALTCGLIVGNQSLTQLQLEFHTSEDAHALLDHLFDPNRLLPTFVLTCLDGTNFSRIDAKELKNNLMGLAHVVVAHAEACWSLTERLGRRLSVFSGAVRVYQAGFDDTADPFAHRLVLGDALQSADGVDRTTRWLREMAAKASLHRNRLGQDVPTFATVRASSLDLRQASLKRTVGKGEQLVAALEQVKALQEQVVSIRDENDYYVGEYERQVELAETAQALAEKSAWRIQQLTEKLRDTGNDPDSDVSLPSTWAEFTEWCDKQLAGRLVLTGPARRGARNPVYDGVQTAAQSLLWLATQGRERFMNGGGPLSNISILEGITNAPCGNDSYSFDWNTRRFSAEWHVKTGGNTRDPVRCMRIYYCFDPNTQQIIVSDMPAHRRTEAT